MRVLRFFDSSALAGKRLLGPQVVQVPEQVVVERGAHAHESLAVIDEQSDVELHAGQLGDGQPRDAVSQRGARDGNRMDPVGLAAIAAIAALAGDQPRRHPNDALAQDHEEPLERAGHMATFVADRRWSRPRSARGTPGR
jgi:hypothetical protein